VAAAAARDRAGLTRMLERGNERRVAASRQRLGIADKPGPGG
jgi:hypothetical protein